LLQYTRFGRVTLSIGDNNEEAARLMGLPVNRTKLLVYAMTVGWRSGGCHLGLPQRHSPPYRSSWLGAASDQRSGGRRTLLTGGKGSVISTLIGVLLLGLIFNMLNFINVGGFSLTVYWQAVVRGHILVHRRSAAELLAEA